MQWCRNKSQLQSGLLHRRRYTDLTTDDSNQLMPITKCIATANASNCQDASAQMYDFYQHQRSPLNDKKEYNNFSQETFCSRKNLCNKSLLSRVPSVTSFWNDMAESKHNGLPITPTFMDDKQAGNCQEDDECSVKHYESGFCEKSPDLCCVRGTLTFSLRYDFIHRVLMVHVIRANGIPAENSEPYVKLCLLPERRNQYKTRIFKNCSDPECNEMFSFDVSHANLSSRMLQFTVYNFVRFTRHGLVGNVILRDLFEKSELSTWTEHTMQIIGTPGKDDFGDLLVYLSYSIADRKLYVTVSKAYNLRPMDITGASDPYVKIEQIYQRRRVKARKTSIKRANLNPVYHECLEFDLPLNEIEGTNLLVRVMDWDRIGHDDLLGCCIIGNNSPMPEGRKQWMDCFRDLTINAICDDSDRQPIGTWYSILDEVPEEFRKVPKAKK
uniref:C2 domain-containing protein n=1 Tax=Wuchereria bancrofti TaxID=6293 RepID=A0AAF5PT06_WUCBA